MKPTTVQEVALALGVIQERLEAAEDRQVLVMAIHYLVQLEILNTMPRIALAQAVFVRN